MSLPKALHILARTLILLFFCFGFGRASAATICPIGDCATPPPGITAAQQQALLTASDALLTNSFALAAQSAHCMASLPATIPTPFPDGAHVCFWEAQLASAHGLLAARMQRIALNEPGNGFPPSPLFPALQPLTSAGCLTNAELQASNATLFNLSQALGVAQAVLGNFPPVPVTPSATQLANIQRFTRRLAFHAAAEPALLNIDFQLYPPVPVVPPSPLVPPSPCTPPQPLAPAELVTFQGNVIEAQAPPQPIFELLQNLGADTADTAIITNAWSVLNPATVNADFPAVLADASTASSLRLVSSSLLTRFSTFTAGPSVEPREMEMPGRFTLAAGDAITPLTEDVSFQIGTALATVPAGKFIGSAAGFNFKGVINGTEVTASIAPSASGFAFKFEAEGVGTAAAPAGLPVTLVIGDSTGSK